MKIDDIRLLLVSSSPRRKEILSMVGISFRVLKSSVEEEILSSPIETAVKNAEKKVLSVKDNQQKEEIALAADTIVILDNKILGKPKDKIEALNFLKKLSGRWHTVITGFSLRFPDGRLISSFEESKVKFKKLSLSEIEWYVSTEEPLDKAGAYGIQGIGALFIEKIEGDFFNVMGLPISRIYDILSLELI
ncbi:Septum formation protein Maf [Desulfurobacterium thermolithotrophum DSM 11699]|uniref:dTTP/UTP pyrophosphatase n=1 Tax=Desulfurobacterium thermolithotrophum (strain DSM 11699 / BSA) TaxID=868864 RepID=F0S2Z1_DESTD|nr:Maf family protein [Desulfurobacterium thermolithotrophum]ADY73213.1 Septum formation protein Maf [Desulfurobacterium thermolithotrophum DSM 11699]